MADQTTIPPSKKALEQALLLADEILRARPGTTDSSTDLRSSLSLPV